MDIFEDDRCAVIIDGGADDTKIFLADESVYRGGAVFCARS